MRGSVGTITFVCINGEVKRRETYWLPLCKLDMGPYAGDGARREVFAARRLSSVCVIHLSC